MIFIAYGIFISIKHIFLSLLNEYKRNTDIQLKKGRGLFREKPYKTFINDDTILSKCLQSRVLENDVHYF